MEISFQLDIIEDTGDETETLQIAFHLSFEPDIRIHAAFVEIVNNALDQIFQ